MAQPIAYGADWSAAHIYGDVLAKPVNDRRDGKGNWYTLSFVLRYADFDGQGHAVLTAEEYRSHLNAGLRSLLIYQRTTRDPDGGENRGREFGRAAVAYARHIGYAQGEPIFGCADAPIGSYNLDVAEAFFRGFAAEVRAAGYLAGGYGFADVIYRLQDHDVVDVLWLCGDEKWWRPGIALYQWNNGRVYPGGVEADLVKQFEPIGDDMTLAELLEHEIDNPALPPNDDGSPRRSKIKDILGWSDARTNDIPRKLLETPVPNPLYDPDDPDSGKPDYPFWEWIVQNNIKTDRANAQIASLIEVIKVLASTGGADPAPLLELVERKVDEVLADTRLVRMPALELEAGDATAVTPGQ